MESKQLPKYKCHKEVQAAKIINIMEENDKFRLDLKVDKINVLSFPLAYVSADYISKHKPHIGGYYVVYEDGYESFSPAKAFEAGYTLMPT